MAQSPGVLPQWAATGPAVPSDVPHQVDDARGIIELLFRDEVKRHDVDGHEEESHSCGLIDSRHHGRAKIDVQVEPEL
jgi:hypothetical protein